MRCPSLEFKVRTAVASKCRDSLCGLATIEVGAVALGNPGKSFCQLGLTKTTSNGWTYPIRQEGCRKARLTTKDFALFAPLDRDTRRNEKSGLSVVDRRTHELRERKSAKSRRKSHPGGDRAWNRHA